MKRYGSIGAGLAVVVLCAVFLWYRHAQTPAQVFNDMLRNNLATSGVTRLVSQQGQGLTISQYTQLSLGARPQAHALTVFKQNGGLLATEEISNPRSDVVRYQKLVTSQKTASGKPIDASKLIGQWATLSAGSGLTGGTTSGLFEQTLVGVLPLANLNPAQRDLLLREIHTDAVFSFNPKKVQTVQQNGRKAYRYTVSIKPAAYVALMQRFEKMVGGTQFASLDPNQYNTAAPIAATMTVDVRSHQLAALYQAASNRTETYSGFGVTDTAPFPKASLTTAQLTQRLESLGH